MSVSKLDVFNYLMGFSAIILGLGITCLFDGVSKLIQNKRSYKVYWVHLIWALFVFLLQLNYWWGLWIYIPSVSDWTFILYIIIIIPAIILFIMSDMMFPNNLIEAEATFNLKLYYYETLRTPLFLLLGSYFFLTGLVRFIVEIDPLLSTNNLLRIVGLLIALLLYKSNNIRLHFVFSIVSLMVLIFYLISFSFQPLYLISVSY